MPLLSQAQTVQSSNDFNVPGFSLNSFVNGLSNVKNGCMYGIHAKSFSYTVTADIATYKSFGWNIGYSASSKLVTGLDYDLGQLSNYGVKIPLLSTFDISVAWDGSWDNIGGRNVWDGGPVLSVSKKF